MSRTEVAFVKVLREGDLENLDLLDAIGRDAIDRECFNERLIRITDIEIKDEVGPLGTARIYRARSREMSDYERGRLDLLDALKAAQR